MAAPSVELASGNQEPLLPLSSNIQSENYQELQNVPNATLHPTQQEIQLPNSVHFYPPTNVQNPSPGLLRESIKDTTTLVVAYSN